MLPVVLVLMAFGFYFLFTSVQWTGFFSRVASSRFSNLDGILPIKKKFGWNLFLKTKWGTKQPLDLLGI